MAYEKAIETSRKEKEPTRKTSSTNLKVLSRDLDTIIEDPIDTTNIDKILFPFAVEDQVHCFLSLHLPFFRINGVLSFSPTLPNQELLIKNDMYMTPFDGVTRGFRNNP
ncbi:hypothetical protein AHAS_Ahas10G0068800 [Arachis hypogaea]